MMKLRRFPEAIETLAKDWSNKGVSSDPWEELGPNLPVSDSQPFKVKFKNLIGLAKPGIQKPEPYAAIEKIVSDLAFEVGLPVPPVILWDRGDDKKFAPPTERYVAISAWAFEEDWTWDQSLPTLKEEQKKAVEPIFSGMQAFETWISAREDRAGKHTLVNSKDVSQLAFIDYAFSTVRYWKTENEPLAAGVELLGFNPLPKDDAALLYATERIMKVDAKKIEEIVNRVPDKYLTDLQKKVFSGNLKARAAGLAQLVGIKKSA